MAKYMEKNKKYLAWVFAVAVVLAGAYLVFSGKTSDNKTVKQEENVALESQTEIASDSEGVEVFDVVGSNFKFSIQEMRVKVGDKVRINFISQSGFHDLVIDEFAVATKQMNSGGKDSVEFVADKAGTFEYYCSVMQHRQMGMVGKLIVE